MPLAYGMDRHAAHDRLVRLLQLAHAGERAAAHAYRGHWRSLPIGDERAAIQRIEAEEWEHRHLVHGILADLGAKPQAVREALMGTLGRILGAACFISGWFAPMYGAGKLEAQNVDEYTTAAGLAQQAGAARHVAALLAMAAVEREHEAWFRARCAGHWLARIIPLWAMKAYALPSSRPLDSAAANARVTTPT